MIDILFPLLAEDTYQWILSYMERNELTFEEAIADILNIIADGDSDTLQKGIETTWNL